MDRVKREWTGQSGSVDCVNTSTRVIEVRK